MSIVPDRRAMFAAALALALAGGLAPGPGVAAESYDNCSHFIDALPATLTQQGVWCLRADLATSLGGSGVVAVDVQANNVTLDCNGFKLGGLGGGVDTLAYGVGSTTSRLNTTVRNCNIRGFARGISLEYNGSGHLVENNRLELNRVVGILVSGDGSVVRGNRVLETGGSSTAATPTGISVGFNVDVLDNLVSGVAAKAGSNRDARGIHAVGNDLGTLEGNRVRELAADGTGTSTGIRITQASHASVRANEVSGGTAGGDQGISCDTTQASARANTVLGFTSGIVGCGDDGDNVSK